MRINIATNRQLTGGEETLNVDEDGLTRSEIVAYKYLLDKGYKSNQIEKTSHHLPDFVTSDDNRFEVKQKCGNTLRFTDTSN